MTHLHRFRRALVGWTLLVSLGAVSTGIAGGAQPVSRDPLTIVPADALFCVRINQLTTSLGQVDQFLTGISPFGVSMPVRAQLGKLLGAAEPAGIDMAGDFAVFGPLPGGEIPDPRRVGVLVPVSDFQQFLTNPNVTKPNAQGILAINLEGKPTIAGIQMGKYLLLTPATDQQALTEAKNWTSGGAASLSQRLSPDELKRAAGSPAWAYANVQVLAKRYGPTIQQKIKETTQKMQEAQAKGGPMAVPQAALDIWTSLLNSFLQETQFVSLSIDPSPSAIRLAPVVAGVPNSDMAKILSMSGTPPEQAHLVGYLENGAIMDGVVNFSPAFSQAMALKRIDLLTALLGPALSQEDTARWKKLATDSADAFGGTAAWAFLPDPKSKPPFKFRYVFVLKDQQKFSDILDQVSKMINEVALADLTKKLGLKMQFSLKRSAETYQEVPIDAIRVALQPTDENSPQGQMMKTLFGAGLNLRLAVVNSLLLYTLAADPDQEIRALIDQAKAGTPGQMPSEVQAALPLIPDARKADFFGTYNYTRAIQMALSFMPMPMPVPQVEASPQSDIAFAGNIGNGRLLTNIAIPKQQILDIMKFIMTMQQQKMQEQKSQPEQPGAQPPAAPSKSSTRRPGQT